MVSAALLFWKIRVSVLVMAALAAVLVPKKRKNLQPDCYQRRTLPESRCARERAEYRQRASRRLPRPRVQGVQLALRRGGGVARDRRQRIAAFPGFFDTPRTTYHGTVQAFGEIGDRFACGANQDDQALLDMLMRRAPRLRGRTAGLPIRDGRAFDRGRDPRRHRPRP